MQEDSDMRAGVILLALESNNVIAEELILIPYSIDFKEIDGLKLSLLLIELNRFCGVKYSNIEAR